MGLILYEQVAPANSLWLLTNSVKVSYLPSLELVDTVGWTKAGQTRFWRLTKSHVSSFWWMENVTHSKNRDSQPKVLKYFEGIFSKPKRWTWSYDSLRSGDISSGRTSGSWTRGHEFKPYLFDFLLKDKRKMWCCSVDPTIKFSILEIFIANVFWHFGCRSSWTRDFWETRQKTTGKRLEGARFSDSYFGR